MALRSILPVGVLLVLVSGATSAAPSWRILDSVVSFTYGLVLVGMMEASVFVASGVVAAWLVDQGHGRLPLVLGSIAVAAGTAALSVPGDIGWAGLIASAALLAAGHGAVAVGAFAMVARASPAGWRPWAIGGLLVAGLVGAPLAGFLFEMEAGGRMLTAAGILLVGGLAALATAPVARPARRHVAAAAQLAGAALLACGLFALMVAADPTNVALLFLLTPLRPQIDAVDTSRALIFLLGGIATCAGSWMAFRRLGASGGALAVAVAVGSVSFATAATSTRIVIFVSMAEERPVGIHAVIPLVALLALVAGAFWAARSGAIRLPATIGAAAAVAGVLLAAWLLTAEAQPEPAVALGATSLALGGAGLGLVSSVLRAWLADSDAATLGTAAAMGVLAAEIGATLGATVGNREVAVDTSLGISPGLLVTLIVVLAGLGGALLTPRVRTPPVPA